MSYSIAKNSITGKYWNGAGFTASKRAARVLVNGGEVAVLKATYLNVVTSAFAYSCSTSGESINVSPAERSRGHIACPCCGASIKVGPNSKTRTIPNHKPAK